MVAIAESGANIHLARQSTPAMAPIIMDNKMKERLTYGRTMESTHIGTPNLPGLIRIAR